MDDPNLREHGFLSGLVVGVAWAIRELFSRTRRDDASVSPAISELRDQVRENAAALATLASSSEHYQRDAERWLSALDAKVTRVLEHTARISRTTERND